MNEATTRKELIDNQLKEAGWNINDQSQVVIEYNIALDSSASEPNSKYDTTQFSDYVLLGKNGKALAVVEAKKSSWL